MKRVITALILILAVLYIVFFGNRWAVLAAVSVAAVICFHEYCGIARVGFRAPGYAAGLVLLALGDYGGIGVVLFALAVMAIVLRLPDLAQALPQASGLLFGIVYIFGAWRCAVLLRETGPYWLLYALAINWVGDIAAYYVGRSFGRRKLAPRVSPGKSWEGAVASTAAAVVFGVLYLGKFAPMISGVQAAGLSVAANIAGQVGDLCESALKRGAGVKDSGTLLPGHGGLLDRVDSSLFAMPTVYLFVLLVKV